MMNIATLSFLAFLTLNTIVSTLLFVPLLELSFTLWKSENLWHICPESNKYKPSIASRCETVERYASAFSNCCDWDFHVHFACCALVLVSALPVLNISLVNRIRIIWFMKTCSFERVKIPHEIIFVWWYSSRATNIIRTMRYVNICYFHKREPTSDGTDNVKYTDGCMSSELCLFTPLCCNGFVNM